MDSSKKKALEESYERIINVGLCIVPYEDLSDLASPELMLFGTTKDEKVFSFSDLDAMFKSQYEQMAGFEPSLDRKRLFTRISNDGNNAFITEEVTLTISSPESVNAIFIRCSCVMEYIDNQWKLTHWHASTPVETENDHWHLEEWKREKEKLQKLVDEQTADLHTKNRELEIEAALEKVRSRTSAMQKSEELADAAYVLFEQLRALGGNLWATGFGLCEENKEVDVFWFANENGVLPRISIPNTTDPAHKQMYEGWKKKKDLLAIEGSGEELKSHYEYFMSLPEVKPIFQKILDDGLSFPDWQQWNAAYFSHGYLLIITLEPYPEPDILKRFAKVFEQTYTRFLDLKKAEAQIRESEVQLALERVRAKSMAMHKSEDLADLSLELVQQVHSLGIDTWFCAFNIYDDHPEGSLEWGSNGQGVFPKYRTPREGVFLRYYEAGQNGESLLINEIDENECPAHYEYLCSLPGVGEQLLKIKAEGISFPTSQIDHAAFFKYGYILFITFEPAPEAHDIFKRFAQVFEQTYTRFLDLQKAEEQAREAQIEAALERVRSRSLAMHKTDELQDVVRVVAEELKNIGVILDTGGAVICTYFQDSKDVIHWTATEDTTHPSVPFMLPYFKNELFDEAWVSKNRGDDYFAKVFSYDVKNAFWNHAFEHSDYRQLPDDYKKIILESESHGLAWAWSENSAIMIPSIQGDLPSAEEKKILIRFAKVFEQSFIRFLDLQKAEEQAREAKIETALEKIRSRTMAMQKGEELQEVAVLLYKELIALGVTNFVTCGYVEIREDINRQYTWVTAPGGDTLGLFYLPLTGDATFDERYAAWKNQQTVFHQSVAGQVRSDHLEYAITTFNSKEAEEMVRSQFPDPTVFYCFNFSHGYLHLVGGSLLEKEEEELLARFTKVFEQTYTRFLDLQKAEAQAREAKIEAALEKVRSRTMGMQSSDELPEVANLLFLEVQALGIPAWSCGYNILNDDKKSAAAWMSSEGTLQEPFKLRLFGEASFDEMEEFILSDEPMLVQELGGKELEEHYTHMKSFPDLRPTFENIEAQGHSLPTYQINHLCKFSHGFLLFITYEPVPDAHDIFKRFTKVFDQTYTRFLDLKKAEEQARESQIEAALERVRARSMGMQKSGELIKVVRQIGKEVSEMDIDVQSSQIWTDFSTDPDDGLNIWVDVNGQSYLEKFHIPFVDQPITSEFYEALEKNLDFFSERYSKSEKDQFFRFLFKNSDLKSIPQERKDLTLNAPGWIRFTVILNNSCLHFGRYYLNEFTEEEKGIFIRLGKAFGQAYTRFLDLQKAEEQAREAQIEASLERVRAKAMSMQNSDELDEVLSVLCEQFDVLGILPMSTHMTVLNFENNSFTFRETGKYGDRSFGEQTVDLDAMDTWKDTVDKWKADKATAVNKLHFPKETLPEVWEVFHESFASMPEESRITPNDYPDGIYHTAGKHPFGYIGMNQTRPATGEEEEIVIKFANEFGRAYQRFLDLQKAEEQAREAQIEVALEKVRSRTMGMQKSDELADVANVLFEEMNDLVDNLWTCGFVLCEKDREEDEWWLSLEDGFSRGFFLPNVNDYAHAHLYEGWLKKDDFRTAQLEGDKLQEHYDWLMEIPVAKSIFDDMEAAGMQRPEWQKLHAAYFSKGYLVIITREPCAEEAIFKRFAQVFDLTYTRFLDLQKAEQRTREAQIETALEKVRSRSLEMQKPSELEDVIITVNEQLKQLNLDISGGAFIVFNDKITDDEFYCWGAGGAGDYVQEVQIPFLDRPISYNIRNAIKERRRFFTEMYSNAEKQEFFNHLFKYPPFNLSSQSRKNELISLSGGYARSCVVNEHTSIFIINHNGIAFSDEDNRILKQLGRVFEQAYTRYLDLKRSENQALLIREERDRLEVALHELNATQDQLIQQEKLASLGQLTAGIAHEIKNPLNFVNNFSDLSVELVQETKDELSAISDQLSDKDRERVNEAFEILNDIEANLKKVHEHGSRADSIVKSMLEHSRGGSGKMEPTDLNALLKEFVNLSFHGMRAGNKPINVDLDFQLDDSVTEVPLIAEDFSRVIINLSNNAFDAMKEKLNSESRILNPEKYTPKLTIRTQKDNSGITIEIEDNGLGIPNEIKDNILQPFFTTKKGTQGTGLGLSITNDIVKAHRGSMNLKSTAGEGTRFIIKLPGNTKNP